MPTDALLLALFCGAAAFLAWRGVRRCTAALRSPAEDGTPLRLVRGLRDLIVALCLVLFAGAVVRDSRLPFLIGLVILAEELYETGLVIMVLRWERQRVRATVPARRP